MSFLNFIFLTLQLANMRTATSTSTRQVLTVYSSEVETEMHEEKHAIQ